MKPKNILVTGATSGIGRAAALYLARRGHRVFATGRRQEALDALTEEAAALSLETPPLETLRLDVTCADSIAAARREIDERTSGYGLDVLVNNAGYGTSGPTEMCTDGDMRAQYDTNVFGLMAVTRAFLPAMRERGQGRVVNVSSIGGRVTFPLMGVYNSTKYAVESLTDALRVELRPFGVRFSLIEPGVIDTGFSDRSLGEVKKYQGDSSSPYALVLARADELKVQTDRTAVSPRSVVRAIAHAAEARWPRPRYVAPFGYHFMLGLFALLPTSWLDAMMGSAIGLTRKGLGVGASNTPRLNASSS